MTIHNRKDEWLDVFLESLYITSVHECHHIEAGDEFTEENIWVKRPGTGEIKADGYGQVLGQRSRSGLPANIQLTWADVVL